MADESWPSFLDCLESDPDRAWSEFFVYAQTLLKESHLKSLNKIHPTEREDAIQDFICHCCSSGFKKLRKYKKTGLFRKWLLTVANNFFKSWLRKSRKTDAREIHPVESDDNVTPWQDRLPGTEPGPYPEATARDLKTKLNACIAKLKTECRALMRALMILDFDTKAVARLLRLTRDGAFYKQLRGCEQELRVEAKKVGLEIYLPGHLAPEPEKGIA